MEERLQKVLAHAGVASRRKCEQLILEGRVTVNDEIVQTLGVKVDPNVDIITVNGRPIKKEENIYIAFHKPKGVITSVTDPQGRKTVTDFFKNTEQRIYPVGRLDYDSEGLLLLTNDGEFANILTHPRHQISKTYLVHVKGIPHGTQLEKLQGGVQLDDGMTSPADVEYYDVDEEAGTSIISVSIKEGKNRQVRRMFESIGFQVQRLRRIQFGSLSLGRLGRGKSRNLTAAEVKELLKDAVKHKL